MCFVCKHHHSKLGEKLGKSFTSAGHLDVLSLFNYHQAAGYHRLAMKL